MEWQPIETAPKDVDVMLWRTFPSCQKPSIGKWDPDKYAKKPRPYWSCTLGRIMGVHWSREWPPSHWMPLPSPPKPTSASQ